MDTDKAAQLQSLAIDRSQTPTASAFWSMLLVGIGAALVAALLMWWWMNQQLQSAIETANQTAIQSQQQIEQSRSTNPAQIRRSGLVASGYVVARRQATVSAEITGTIRQILFEEGSVVAKGQVLARLDDQRAQIGLQQIRAHAQSAKRNVQSMQAQRVEAQIVLDRAKTLAERQIGPKAAVTAADAALNTLQARLAGAKADQMAALANVASQIDLVERHVVRAPYGGVVIAKNAQIGEILSPSSAGGGFTRTGIATMVDMQSLEIEVDVNEGQIGRVLPDQQVIAVLDAYQDWKIPAKVIAIIPTADRSRATIKVRVAFEQLDKRILPDMAAKVTFVE